MGKYRISTIVVMTRKREYTIFANSEDDAKDILSATNFDFQDFDEEEFIDNQVIEVKKVERIEE